MIADIGMVARCESGTRPLDPETKVVAVDPCRLTEPGSPLVEHVPGILSYSYVAIDGKPAAIRPRAGPDAGCAVGPARDAVRWEIQPLGSNSLPVWVENWVENRRCLESVETGAAAWSCSVHPNTRTPGGSSHGCSVHCRYSECMTVTKSDCQPVNAADGSAAESARLEVELVEVELAEPSATHRTISSCSAGGHGNRAGSRAERRECALSPSQARHGAFGEPPETRATYGRPQPADRAKGRTAASSAGSMSSWCATRAR